jgi:hypothetical protein
MRSKSYKSATCVSQEDADFKLVIAGPDSEVRWVVQAVCVVEVELS